LKVGRRRRRLIVAGLRLLILLNGGRPLHLARLRRGIWRRHGRCPGWRPGTQASKVFSLGSRRRGGSSRWRRWWRRSRGSRRRGNRRRLWQWCCRCGGRHSGRLLLLLRLFCHHALLHELQRFSTLTGRRASTTRCLISFTHYCSTLVPIDYPRFEFMCC
jgi:hypothetical protein